MEITLYKIKDDANVVSKATTVLNTIGTYTGTPIPPSSVLHPQIYITIPTQTGAYCGANYAYITEYNRYYFVNNPTWVNNDVWSVQMDVDVLTSNDSGLRALNAFVVRSASNGNPGMTDTSVPTTVETVWDKHAMTYQNGPSNVVWYGSDCMEWDNDHNPRSAIVALNIAYTTLNGDSTHYYSRYNLTYVTCQLSELGKLMNAVKQYQASALAKLGHLDSLSELIQGVWVLPYAVPRASSTKIDAIWSYTTVSPYVENAVSLGSIGDYFLANMGQIAYVVWKYDLPCNVDRPYKDVEPFRTLSVEFFPMGVASLDATLLGGLGEASTPLYVWLQASSLTGDAQLFYGAVDINNPSLSDIINGCREPLGVTNLKITMPSVGGHNPDTNIIQSGVASAQSAGKMFEGASTAAGVIGGAIAGAVWAHNNLLNPTTPNVTGSVGNPLVTENPVVLIKSKVQGDIPEDYIGLPCYQTLALSGVSGFTQIGDIHLDTLQLFEEEKTELLRILKEGVRF